MKFGIVKTADAEETEGQVVAPVAENAEVAEAEEGDNTNKFSN